MAKDHAESRTTPAIAMVATATTRLPDAPNIIAAASDLATAAPARRPGFLASFFGKKLPASAAAPAEQRWRDNNLVFTLPTGTHVAVSLMPAPIPWPDLEGPCATAWWWPEATERMQSHRYHFVIALIGGEMDPVERRALLTHVVRAVVRTTDAVGVYWGEGTLVHEAKQFLDWSSDFSAEQVPLPLWVDVRVEKNPDDSFHCFTTGLEPLGFFEIEVERSRLEPSALLEFVGDTACYIVNGRKHIGHGETMGRTETERYKVRHASSMFGRGTVMRLTME